jgi:hypothetical protein
LNERRLAAHKDNFQAMVVIEVTMQARNDRLVILMLNLRQLIEE